MVPDHTLLRLIGKGSYGEVWLARNVAGTFRAIKIVHLNAFRNQRPFEREFKGVLKFEPISRSHQGFVDVLQVGRNDEAGYFYCIMELADDARHSRAIFPETYAPRTLSYDLSCRGQLPISECQRIGAAIASALDFLHRQGLIHRDIKSSNIIFINGAPKLADIGLVTEMAEARSYVGTEGFIPPEGPGTVQADLYSLGKVLYEISTGRDRHDYPELPTQLGAPEERKKLIAFNRIILNACRANPQERYRSAGQMLADIAASEQGKPVALKRGAPPWLRFALRAAPALLALGLGASWLRHRWTPGATPPDPPPLPAPPGLVGWWRADGDASDSAGTHDGELYGVSFVTGKVGKAFNFTPSQHRIRIRDSDDFKLANSLTIEGWVLVRTGGGIIFQRGDERVGWQSYLLSSDERHQILFEIGSGAGESCHVAAPLAGNQWKHIAGTLDGASGEMRLFIDGVIAARTNTALRPLRNLDPTRDPSIGIGNVGTLKDRKSVV